MSGRVLKAEGDRVLAAQRDSSRRSASKDGLSAPSPACSPREAKNPTGERGSSSRGQQERVENGYKQIHAQVSAKKGR